MAKWSQLSHNAPSDPVVQDPFKQLLGLLKQWNNSEERLFSRQNPESGFSVPSMR